MSLAALPSLPRKIGIVTSPMARRSATSSGEAGTTISQRAPGHPADTGARRRRGRRHRSRPSGHREVPIDVVMSAVAAVGGGLVGLNEEVVARAIAASPVRSHFAVGHEVDVTIADFA